MGIGTGPGPLNENTLPGLMDLCNSIPCREQMTMVEIGCYLGVSTELFCLHFGKVHGIDIWGLNQDYKEANWSIKRIGSWETIKNAAQNRLSVYPNCKLTHGFSETVVNEYLDKSLDFVYIDGRHAQVDLDVKLWSPKIKSGGYIGGHDFYGEDKGVGHILKYKTDLDVSKIKLFSDRSWLYKLD